MTEAVNLAAIEEIRLLKARYLRALDTKDWPLLRSLLTDDMVGDFREMIADHNTYDGPFGSFVRVAREGAGMKVQFGTIEKRGCAETQTTYVGDGFGWVTSCVADYSAFVERANWYFQDCH